MFDRFFWNDDSTLTDQTKEWSDQFANSALWDAKSYLYVSSFLPFNHKYFDITTSNDQTGTLTCAVWVNDGWQAVKDIVDNTHNGTQSLVNSGNIIVTLDKDYGWDQEDDTADITALEDVSVYNAYWMRFGFNASSDSVLEINYIGQRFSDDNALFSYYPMLNQAGLMTRFKAGKADWNEQSISASEILVSDMKFKNLIISKDQILDIDHFKIPNIHKTAEIIFRGLGAAYNDHRIEAKEAYGEIMKTSNFGIDQNQDGKLDRAEHKTEIQRFGR